MWCKLQGDSSGPLMCKSQRGEWILHGVISSAVSGCLPSDNPDLLVDVSELREWIQYGTGNSGKLFTPQSNKN